jgi:hypothetical protein
MGYWTQEYLLQTFGGPLVEAEFIWDMASAFFVPKVFMGYNLFLDRPGLLPDAVDYIARECPNKKAFLVTDDYAVQFVKKVTGPYEKRHGIRFEVWDGAKPDCPIDTVYACAEKMRAWEPTLIFGLGGGSSMDTAKGAWLVYEHPEIDLTQCGPLSPMNLRTRARLVAIPTTSGTGSEMSPTAVLSWPKDGVKIGTSGALPEFVPDFALLDPTLTVGMPAALTAGTGGDVLAHAIDAFLVPKANELCQCIALKAIQMVFEWLPRAYRNGKDLYARAKMQLAASMAGIPLGMAGSGISHAMGQTVGGLFHVHHGVTVILFIPYELQIYSRATDRYLELCDALGVRDKGSDEKSLLNLIDKIRGLMKDLGIPISLKEAGISRSELDSKMEEIVRNTKADPASWFNWYECTPAQWRDVYEHAYDGTLLDLKSDPWR